MADPGFPIGGVPAHWGGANLQCIHFLAKMYAKSKEIDPVGGARAGGAPLDPPMTGNFVCYDNTNNRIIKLCNEFVCLFMLFGAV